MDPLTNELLKSAPAPSSIGEAIYLHAQNLFPVCRSLSGQGVRDTLAYIKAELPELNILSFPTGYRAFDWETPDEWNIRDAWIKNSRGEKIIDFRCHNLHVMGYSEPVDKKLGLEELKEHLYSLPDQPTAIPYITSYYKRRWGFCLPHEQLLTLPEDEYHVYIDASLEPGEINLGELVIKGETDEEILLSTYVCHPSMGNNELSGPCVTLELARWLQNLKGKHRYSYRIVFLVETLGSLLYLSKNLPLLKEKLKAGFVLSCVGDDKDFSIVHTPDENTLADRALTHVLKYHTDSFTPYPFTRRGSDERQYCSPGADLPVVGFCRSKYGTFPEYHTSLDNLEFITPTGLGGAFVIMQKAITLLENDRCYKTIMPGEPQLGKRGLYPTISTKETASLTRGMMNFIAYSNGKRSLLDIAEKIDVPAASFYEHTVRLLEAGVIKAIN